MRAVVSDAELLDFFEGAQVTIATRTAERRRLKSCLRPNHPAQVNSGDIAIKETMFSRGWLKHRCRLKLANGQRYEVKLVSFPQHQPDGLAILRMFLQYPTRFSKIPRCYYA